MFEPKSKSQLGHFIENQFGDKYLFSVNRKLFEQIDYKTQFNKEFAETFNDEDTLYIILGTDSGLMVRHILKHPPAKGSTYLFIEFQEIIEATKNQYDLSQADRIIVSTMQNWEEQAKKIGMDIYFMINKVRLIKSFASQYHYINEYLIQEQQLFQKIEHLKWQYQSQLGSKTFIQKQLENLPENQIPAKVLGERFKGKTAIILAGGPSLDKYINWIEENQEHCLVIAVTRIARRLLQTRIRPDIFVSVDPYIANFNASKEVFNYEKDCLLVNQYHITPMLLGNWLGISLYLGDRFPWKTPLNQENLTGIGPTVTNTAIMLSINLGIKQTILFGVDLCYSQEGFTHANGSNEHDNGPVLNLTEQTIITNKGDKANTNSAYYEAAKGIEQLGELAQKTNHGVIINPSPDSARIKSVKHMELKNIDVNKTDQISIKEFLTEINTQYHSKATQTKYYNDLLNELNKALIKIKQIKKLASKGLDYNKKFFSNGMQAQNFKYKHKMDNIEKELNNRKLTDLTELSKKFGVNEFLNFLNPDTDRELTDEEIKKSGKIYYKALKNGAAKFEQHIFTSINIVESRLIENNALKISRNLFKRHLVSFNTSYLLDGQINIQKNNINKIAYTSNKETLRFAQLTLENLKLNKQETIDECKEIYQTYINKNSILNNNNQIIFDTIKLYILLLHYLEMSQERRINLLKEKNPDIFKFSNNTKELNNKVISYIARNESTSDTIHPYYDNEKKLKINNIISNMPDNYMSTNILKDTAKDITTIILTDDTYLEHLHWIEEHQKQSIIIADTKLCESLISTKIIPHILIPDAQYQAHFTDNKQMYQYEEKCVLVHNNDIHPKLLGNWLGDNLYIGPNCPWDTPGDTENKYINSDKSLITSLYISHEMGSNRHVLFTKEHELIDNLDHIHSLINLKDSEIYSPIITNALTNKNIKINKIKLDNLKFSKSVIDTRKALNEKINNYKKKNSKANFQKQLLKKINSVYKEIEDCLANKIIKPDELKRTINILYPPPDSKNNDFTFDYGLPQFLRRLFTLIVNIENRLIESDNLTTSHALISRHLSSENLTHLDCRINFRTINRINTRLITRLKEKDISLGNNQEERQTGLTLYCLLFFNSYNDTQRRLFSIKKNNAKLLAFKKDFVIYSDITISKIIEGHIIAARKLSGEQNNEEIYRDLETNLYNFYKLKDTIELKNIIPILENLSNKELTDPFLHLAKGYLYELQNRPLDAINEYGQADSSKTKESALKQITLISLENGNLEYAHNALQLLSEISPDYLPQLAELYVLTKNYKDALDVYSNYLDYNPSDIYILLKVAKLYKMQNILDGEQFIYKRIIEIDPDNKIANENIKP